MQIRAVLMVLAVAAPLLAVADPAALSENTDSLPKSSCSEITYSDAFLQRYPKAPAGCIEVRTLNGEKYAKFNGKVYLIDPNFVTVSLLNVAGDPTSTFSFKAPDNAPMYIGGKPQKLSDVKVGDVVTFWVPEKRFEASSLPGPTKDAWRVLPPQK